MDLRDNVKEVIHTSRYRKQYGEERGRGLPPDQPLGKATPVTRMVCSVDHTRSDGLRDDSRKETGPDTQLSGMVGLGGKVLIMDDHEPILETLGGFLKIMGFRVEKAKDGATGLKKYIKNMRNNTPFDVVITDLMVNGGMGGLEMSEMILDLDPAAKIVISSGQYEEPAMAKWEEYGFAAALPKPYSMDDMLRVIKKALM